MVVSHHRSTHPTQSAAAPPLKIAPSITPFCTCRVGAHGCHSYQLKHYPYQPMTSLSQRIAALSPEQQALLQRRLHQQPSQSTTGSALTIPRRAPQPEGDLRFPVSFGQQRMWFQDQLGLNSAVSNNVSVALTITGALDVAALERSLRSLIQRHEILRTTLQLVEGDLVQVIAADVQWDLKQVDLRSHPAHALTQTLQTLTTEQACQPLDLSQEWALRALLVHRHDNDYTLLITLHHSAGDAWSFGIFFRELSTLYRAYSQGQPSPLPALPIQYADFAVWQRQYFQGHTLEQELNYWRQTLQGAPEVLPLPTDYPRPPVQSFRGQTRAFLLPQSLTEGLKQIAQQQEATLFMVLLAGLQTLLYRYTGAEDILIGSPIANRLQPEVESLMGCFINTLVLRTDLSGQPTFAALLQRVRTTVLGALAHQTLPFEQLVETLQPTRNVAYAPFFQVMLVLQNAFSIQTIELPGVEVNYARIENHTAQFDLTFHLVESDQGLIGKLEYNTDLWSDPTITRLVGHLQTLLTGIVANPQQRLIDLPLMTPAEQQQLQDWQRPPVPYADTARIQDLITLQGSKTPDEIALVSPSTTLTYRELEARANQVAHVLQALGVQSDTLVGLWVERSAAMIISLLGILKAGAAYLPLDPGTPAQRVREVLADAQVVALVTQTDRLAQLPDLTLPHLCWDADAQRIAQAPTTPPINSGSADSLAYVIYTSGSTGKPKGVMVPHRGLVNYTEVALRDYGLIGSGTHTTVPPDRVLQFASISFDAAAEEIFPCLAAGATLVLRTEAMISSMSRFLATCAAWGVTVLDLPTAFWHHLVTEMAEQHLTLPPTVRLVILGGEKALPDRLALWQQRVGTQVRLINSYGPTEATIVTTTLDLTDWPVQAQGGDLPIGYPISNAQTYVLDAALHPVPIGIPGELYIGGVGVARGYLHRPDLTAQAFLPNPFSGHPEARLYKTGDRVRYRADGALEFLGRIDQQVKIRGFRIELGEIEAVIAQHPAVQLGVVCPITHPTLGSILVGYGVPQGGLAAAHRPTLRQLRQWLEKRLPHYMVPTAWMWIDTLPLTPTGKVDRRALPIPDLQASQATPALPRTPLETDLATTFAQVLGLPSVGIDDDFFDLGGHSLLATKLLAQVLTMDYLSPVVDLTLVDLFESPTVAGLAERIESLMASLQTGGRELRQQVCQGQAGEELPEQSPTDPQEKSPLDLAAEVMVDPTIVPPPGSLCSWSDTPNHILLTGATGFLGAFLLAELLHQTEATVYCLVRARTLEQAEQKLQANLAGYGLWDPAWANDPSAQDSPRSRLVPVLGDLSQPRLGLAADQFYQLAQRVDVIYHSAASVNLVYPYSALKPINVWGTQEVFRLASHSRIKPVHFISTLSVVHSVDYVDRGIVTEADGDCWQGLYNGYSQTKWVAEQMAAVMCDRNLPVYIYRPGVITGHSHTGACNPQDFLNTLIQGLIQLQAAPDLDALWDLTPVDYVSQAIIHLSRQPGHSGQVFHLLNPQPVPLRTVIDLMQQSGYPLQTLDYCTWRTRLASFAQADQASPLASLLSIFPEQFSASQTQLLTMQFDCQNTLRGLADSQIRCPVVDRHLLQTYLTHLTRLGILAPP